MHLKWGKGIITTFLLIGLMQCFCLAQQPATGIEKDIEELKNGQKAIRGELQMIKTLLLQLKPNSGAPVVPTVNIRDAKIDVGANPVLNKGNTNLVMVEFSDYECPFCGRYARETFPEIMKQYIDSGKIGYAIVDSPLSFHKLAPKAAEASHCAEEQGKFWEMHSELMSKQNSLNNLSSLAVSTNLDMPKFEACLSANKYAEKVTKNLSVANKLGISGVPAFILAMKDPADPQKLNGVSVMRGAQPFANFQKEIDQALANLSK
jgi:protein-disulfide isomerase